MSGRNVISRELADSIRHCLGRKVKLSLKVIVKAELKSDKLETRVLGFSTCRLFVLTAKIPTRVDQHFHYLDIQGIESKKPNQLCLTVCDKSYTFHTHQDDSTGSHEVDNMVLCLGTALKNIFPSVPIRHIIRKIDIQPSKRWQELLDELEKATLPGARDMGPCGGFSDQYACMCDYHALPYRAEVAWDVDTIYLSHDTRELYLHDFDYLEQKDLIPIISALEYNTWFRKFRASHSKLSHEAIERILHIVSKSLSIEELYMDNIGAKVDFANKLSSSLLSNSNIPLQKLDISHNPIEDKGAVHISNPIGRQAKGLAHLNLAYCGLTSKGVNMIAHSFNVNKYMCQTLTFLSFSGNSLRDEVNNLYNFLAQPNVLKTLDLSSTECAIDAVFGALLRGCTSHLSHLNLSKNGFGNKKSKEMLPSFKQYFTSTLALKNFNLSYCKLPADALKNVLLGLACNENITDVELDLSNNQLSNTGAQILESCIHGVRCLSSLDISDNGLENQLGPVVLAISKNKNIKKLNIARNLNNIKSKHVSQVMEAVVHMLQEEDCVLEHLYFNDSRLKTDLHSLLNALGSNRCLLSLDISGNYMGDSGARLLAKALQINSKLQYISYDRNNVSLLGYSDIAYALQSNYSVKFMPFPVHDSMLCMKAAPDRTENIMRKIQDCLYRNVSPMKYSHGQAFRLQQGFLLSSTQQQVDRMVLQTGEVARTLKRTMISNPPPNPDAASGVNSLLQWSDALINDAENSKQLISHLHDVVLRRDESGNSIETKLRQLSKDLHSVIKKYLQDTVESMVRSAQDKCPNVLAEEKVVDDIRSSCLSKSHVAHQFIEEAIVEQAGSIILNKVSEVNLTLSSTVSDRVIDEVVDSLSKTCKSLQTGEGHRKRASTGTELCSRERGSSESSTRSERSADVLSQGDDTSQKSDPSPMATPQLPSKRKSHHGWKLRPQSVVAAESLDSVSELPTSCGQLQHLGKARPRRVKTRAPTRPMGKAELVEEDHDISQGVDNFFRPGSTTPTTPLASPDSENSNFLHKYGSTSSIESSPYTIGTQTASAESLTRSDSLITKSDCDTAKNSPKLKTPSKETGEDEPEGESNKKEHPSEEKEKRTMSSLLGKLGAESVRKLSPDLGNRKIFPSPSSTTVEEESPPKKVTAGVSLYGRNIVGNVLAEMKARQGKRTSYISKDEDKKEDNQESTNLLGSVKLRSTGLANNLKSPTNQFSNRSPTSNRESTSSHDLDGELSPISGNIKPTVTGFKPKPPPPLAPKPRPKSAFSPDSKSDLEITTDEETTPRSVRELAASLANKSTSGTGSSSPFIHEESPGKKSSSLPRNSVPVTAGGGTPLGGGPSIPASSVAASFTSHQMEELEETAVDGEMQSLSLIQRQTSHKHVLNDNTTIEDVIDV